MMKLNLIFLFFMLLTLPALAVGADSLSYSGRLTNANGSPVIGPVKLKFDLAYTDDLTYLRCSYQIDSVDLINGVFHSKLVFNCPSSSLKKVIEETPANHSIAIRVTDLSAVPAKVYSYQAIHSLPFSLMSEMSKQLVQMGATDGQVLTWSSLGWIPADPVSTTNGTVTSLTATDGLYGGTITDSGIIGLVDGGVTSQKLNQMGAAPGEVLKWTLGGWAPAPDNDTAPAAEADPHVLKFARSDMMAMPIPDNCAADEKLQYAPAMQTFVCSPIVLSDTAVQSAVVADAINDNETEKAPSQNAVFDALAGKQNTIDQSTDLTVKSLKIQTDGSTWMGLVAPATSSNISFTLPGVDGQINQVLKTDGSGNLGWMDVNAGTITGITTTAPLSGSGTSGSINISLAGDSISNTHIASGANIDWSKINKTGAVASDLGAVPSTRSIATGTGLLGGGDLSSNRTLSVDVGTNAGQILQVGTDGKLPVVDGSKLTNLEWSQILTSTLPVINAGTGMTTSGSLVSGQTLNVDVGIGDGQIVQVQTGGRLPALDGSQLTNLGSNLGKWSDATGGIQYSGGRVGVTTSSPEEKIHIHAEAGVLKSALRTSWVDTNSYGEWNAYEGSTFMGGISVMGSNVANADWRNAFLMSAAKNDLGSLIFRTRTSNVYEERMVVKNDGKVGIGIINPTAKLSVYGSIDNSGIAVGSDTSGLDIYNNDTNPGSYALLRLMSFGAGDLASADGNYFMSKANANNDIDLFIGKFTSGGGDQNLMTIKSNGHVGIGTVSPQTTLHLSSPIPETTIHPYRAGLIAEAEGTGPGARIASTTYSANQYPVFIGYRARGTKDLPEPVLGNDVLLAINGGGFDGSKWVSTGTGIDTLRSVATQDWSPTARGSKIILSTTPNDSISGAIRMTINQDGNVGIGNENPQDKLHIGGNISANMGEGFRLHGDSNYFGTNKDGIVFEIQDGNNLAGASDGGFAFRSYTKTDSVAKEYMVIREPGNVGIGMTAPVNKLHVAGNIGATGWVGAGCEAGCSTDAYAIIYGDGDIKTYAGTGSSCVKTGGSATFTCSSDERLKNNITLFTDGLEHILKLQPKTYFWNEDDKHELNYGFIAQDVQKVIPHAVTEQERPDGSVYLSLDQGAFTPYMINAIKNLNSKVDEGHARRIASLEEDNLKMKQENEKIKNENKMMKTFLCEKYPEADFCK